MGVVSTNPPQVLRSKTIELPDLAAGADVAGEVIWQPDENIVVSQVKWIFREATAAVAGGNELTLLLRTPGGALSSTGALAADQPAGTVLTPALGAAPIPNVAADANVTLDITQAGVANMGRTAVQIDYRNQ